MDISDTKLIVYATKKHTQAQIEEQFDRIK